MGDSASESDSSSVEMSSLLSPVSPSKEQLTRRNESLQQENRVLKMELDTYRVRVRSLQEENRALKQASVNILAKAEQEEEFISNTLMKQINTLKKEKEVLALNYEQEEECLTNDLSRKLTQLQHEKAHLEQTLEQEQEALVNRLMRKIQKLENDIEAKQNNLEQLRREKVELENTLEQEQENLVNRLWKRMDKLEAEKRMLQEKLDQQVSAASLPKDIKDGNTATKLTAHVQNLRTEVANLKKQLLSAQQEHSKTMSQLAMEEKNAKEENVILQKKLQREVEHRQALSRHLSESESSLEMDEERQFSDLPSYFQVLRSRAGSSPVLHPSPSGSRPLSPGFIAINRVDNFSIQGYYFSSTGEPLGSTGHVQTSLPPGNIVLEVQPPAAEDDTHGPLRAQSSISEENFVKPAPPQ